MTTLNKTKIVEDLREYVSKFTSQNKAAHSLKDVSAATISQMLNDKHELISDEMWRNVAAQIATGKKENWQSVETRDYKKLTGLLKDAKDNSHVFAIIAPAGSGKTETMKRFADSYANAFRLQCSEFWNRKYFLSELLRSMGRDHSGLTVAEMMFEAVKQLKKMDDPLLMLDEADKLSDQVLYFFITLYNELEGLCGIVMCATDHLDKRITRGLNLNKKGYKEIYSRIGRKCIELQGVGSTDVHQICMANGITTANQIKTVWEDCEGDLRRVKRKIHALKNGKQNQDKQGA